MMKHSKRQPLKSKINSFLSSTTMRKDRSLVGSFGGQVLQLSQQQITFINTQQSQVYEIILTIRNVAQKSKKIKLRKPSSSLLSVSIDKDGVIAAGLQNKIIITYNCDEIKEFKDSFFIICDLQYELQIPINVYPVVNNLQFQPFVNFGFIKCGQEKQVQIDIANKGNNQVSLEFNAHAKDTKIIIIPEILDLRPKEKGKIIVKISSKEIGEVQGIIDIEPKQISISSIEFVANFCEYSRFLTDQRGNQTNQIEINPLFSGEKTIMTSYIINNTPKHCDYRIIRQKGLTADDSSSLVTPQEFGKDDEEKLISFIPSEGQIEAYSKKELKGEIMAKIDDNDQQLFCNYIAGKIKNFPFDNKEWTYTMKTYFNDEQSSKTLIVKGISYIPKICMSSTFLEFNECGVRNKCQKVLKIQNFSIKKVKISIENSGNYSFFPNSFELAPNAYKEVIVRFCPQIIGELNQIISINVGAFAYPFRVLGKGKFSKKQQEHKFENGEELKAQDMEDTFLKDQISQINEKTSLLKEQKMQEHSLNSTIHFDINQTALTNFSKQKGKKEQLKKTIKNRQGKLVKIDVTNFDPNEEIEEYPTVGRSPQEDRIVTRELTLSQMRNIPVGPVVVDFGNVFLGVILTKTFHICNFNLKPISIQLETHGISAFEKSSKAVQAIPSESHGGLPIKYEAIHEGSFKHSLQYILNGKNYFELVVLGNAISPTLQLSKNELKFIAGEEDKTFEKKQTITLTNTYPYEVNYIFKNQNYFQVQPSQGILKGNSKVNVIVSHCFLRASEGGGKIEENLKLKIKNGKKIQIKCSSFIPQCNLVCRPNEINFKEVSIYKTAETKIVLRNVSRSFTVFKIQPSKDIEEVVNFSTIQSHLAPDQALEIVLKVMSPKINIIDSSFSIIVRGGRKLNIPLKINIIVPKIKVQQDNIDFGNVPVGGQPGQRTITISNDSSIPTELDFIFPHDSILLRCLAIKEQASESLEMLPLKTSKELKGMIIPLKINGKSKGKIFLEFTPEQIMNYSLPLPLYLRNCNEIYGSLQKTIVCKSIKNKLIANQKQINFGKIIIEQSLDISSKCISFSLKNLQDNDVEWWTNEKVLSPFFLDEKVGNLKSNEQVTLKVHFSNQNPGVFERQIQFFINEDEIEQSKPYLRIPIKAIASFPQIHFDKPYIIMPVVRLNEESLAEFEIINEGYENLNLKHVANPDFSHINFAVKYPKGCNLGITKKSIPVEITFVSDKPISFTAKVDFYDHHNRVFSILVSGTADNCLYTIPEEQWKDNSEGQVEKSCSFLTTYLSSFGFIEDPLYNFPDSLADDDFEKLQKFLTCLSSQYEKADKMRINIVKKNKKTTLTYQYLANILKMIKSEGGFLNQIRPELLMNYNDYLDVLRFKEEIEEAITMNNSFAYYKIPIAEQFEFERKKAWITLIYQIFKVASRIPLKKKNNQFWNQFIQREKVIIQWLQNTYQAQAGLEEVKSSNGLKDIGDGDMLGALLTKYTNIKVLDAYGRIQRNMKEKEKRCKKIMEVFTQIGLVSGAKVEDIVRSNPRQMLAFLERLYLILPSYLQKGQSVIFSCAIGQSLTKSIQISNPSKFPVTYIAKIQGSKAYMIEGESEFVIQSKKSYNLSLKYISNIHIDKENATLTLTGKGSTKFTPSTFIFVLKSMSLGRISQKNIQITSQLYEPHEFQLSIKNNFASDGQFFIEVLSSPFKNNQKFKSLLCATNSIKIKKNSTTSLAMTFFPFTTEKHKFFLIFKDPNVGEFQYEITGIVEQPDFCPQPLKTPYVFFTNKVYEVDVNIPLKNELLIKARKQADTYIEKLGRKNGKRTTTTTDLTDRTIYPQLKIETYTASLYPQTQMIILKNDTITMNLDDEENFENKKKIALEVNMKMPVKEAPLYLSLKNSTGTDIRRYKMFINSIYKPLRYEMQMKIPVNQVLTQPLPLINITEQQNIFNVSLITNDSSKNIFSLDKQSKEVTIDSHEQGIIEVSFHPKIHQNYNAALKIQNITTGQNIDYEIIGVGQQPVAELYKFSQVTQEKKVYNLKIPFTKAKRFQIIKNTLANAKYDKNFSIQNESNSFFKFEFAAKFPGLYEGIIHIEDDEKIHAYQIIVNVDESIEGQVNIETVQRTRGKGKVKLEAGEWLIEARDSNIIVDSKVSFKEPEYIEIAYEATKTGKFESFIVFKNDKLGQFKYRIKINIVQMPEIKIEQLKVELGDQAERTVNLQNPQGFAMNVVGYCTNKESFYFQPQNIVIPARSSLDVRLFYRPTCLQEEEGKIKFTSENNMKWTYSMRGQGCLQQEEKVIEMQAEVGKEIIQSIPFANPFKKQVIVFVFLENEDPADERFRLLSKANKHTLNFMQQLSVPILFQAKNLKIYEGRLSILINQKIYWKYLIRIKTKSISQEEVRSVKLTSRNKKEMGFSFNLPYLPSSISEQQTYKCNLVAKNPSNQALIDNTCRVTKNSQKLKEDKVNFVLNFLSYRPFVCPIFFEIQQKDGCKWLFSGQIQFIVPPVDDEFEIITDINKATSVTFKLNNRTKQHAKFKAYFTSGSDMQFSLKPKAGDLEPYGRQGTQFEVAFAPTQYKNNWNGKIVIETEQSYWSYGVKGNMPHYNPPIGKSLLTNRTHK